MEEPNSSSWNYCRFCAERKNGEKLMKLDSDPLQLNKVVRKLKTLKLKLYNRGNNNVLLPNTICFICWNKFNSALEFYDTFQRAQAILRSLNPENHDNEKLSSDDDFYSNFADLTTVEDKDEDDEPLINFGKHKNKLSNSSSTSNYPGTQTTVKSEKHEDLESKIVQVNALSDQDMKIDPCTSQTGPNCEEITIRDRVSIETTLDCNETNIFNTLLSSCDKTDSSPKIEFYGKELSLEPKVYIKRWKEYPWICFFCSIVLPSIESLREHANLEHFQCAAFRCIDCAKMNSGDYDFRAFISHVRKHRKHLRKVCPYCDIKTDDYKTHLRTHFPNPTTLNCKACGKLFNNEDKYNQHILSTITNNNKNAQDLKPKKKRRKAGQIITLEDLTCEICQKVYKNLNILRDHKRVMHSTENRRIFTCERCGKTFLNKGSLTTHIMGHDKIKPYQCRLCDKGFKFPNLLRRHVDTHSGVKRFKCDQCGRAFRLLSQVNKHKIVHTDTMPFVCQYCPKSFRFKSILDIHERQHTGAKPYSCNECGMEFTNWSNYNKHSKRRHGTDLSKKKITPLGSFPVNPLTGRVMELDDSVACEEWKKQVMLPCKRGPKKGVKK